jgi:hypothetical protein
MSKNHLSSGGCRGFLWCHSPQFIMLDTALSVDGLELASSFANPHTTLVSVPT